MKYNKLENIIVIGLLLVTICTYALQYYVLDATYVLDANSGHKMNFISDLGNGGKSKGTYRVVDEKLLIECEIVASDYAWPYCELAFDLHDINITSERFGIDLSQFDSVYIHATYKNIVPKGIRFQLRTFNPAYSSLADESSWKYNSIEFFSFSNDKPTIIPLNALQVPTWWLANKKIPVGLSAPELDNILTIELATGNGIAPGKYSILLEKIVFHGKIFPIESIHVAIIFLWISSTLFLFFFHLALSRKKLSLSRKKSEELKRLNKLLNVKTKELKNQAERDPLTGALNRDGIQAIFTQEIPVLSLAFIDIDHFKKINDGHGHAIGDEVLKEFAALLSRNSRDTDFLARWGGEEFILVCPNAALKQMAKVAETLRGLIETYSWPDNIHLTASFGIAEQESESPTDFIARADKALYAAKAQGRNRVVTAVSKAR